MNDANELAREHDYVDLKRMLKALGDVVRLSMVEELAQAQEMSVTDLAQRLVSRGHIISQPLVSWHLAGLRRHGFVRTRRHGRLVYCSLDMARYQQCLRMLAELAGLPAADGTRSPSAPTEFPTGVLGARP